MTEECVLFTANNKVNSFGFSSFMSVIMMWESVSSLTSRSILKRKQLWAVSHAWKPVTFDAISHWTLSLTAALYNIFSPPPLGLRNTLPQADRQALIITPLQQHTKLLESSPPIIAWPKLSEKDTHPWLHPPPSSLSPFASLTGSHHGRVAGLAWGNLQPSPTICYVANA